MATTWTSSKRSQKKSRKQNALSHLSTEEKVDLFIVYLKEHNHLLLEQQTRAEIIQTFIDGLHKNKELSVEYMRFSRSLQHREAGDLEQSTPNPIRTIEWAEWNDHEHGRFFINKFRTNPKSSYDWAPSGHSASSYTDIVSFEELYKTDGLQSALIMDNIPAQEIKDYLLKFPYSCDITVICPKTIVVVEHQQRETNVMKFCSEHGCSLVNTSCCEKSRVITVVNPPQSGRFNGRAAILRYKESARIIISSASLVQMDWEKTLQFGWYIDLPIVYSESGEIVDLSTQVNRKEAKNHFASELYYFLEKTVDTAKIVKGVNFMTISPSVHLITTLPGHPRKPSHLLKHLALSRMNNVVKPIQQYWKRATHKPVSRVCTMKLGSFSHKDTHCLGEIFDMPHMFKDLKPERIEIIYPSKSFTDERQMEIGKCVKNKFINNDMSCVQWPYLRNPGCSVLPTCNFFYQYVDTYTEGKYKRTGWIHTGSQTASFGSWGRDEASLKSTRYELGVSIAPYLKTASLICVDMTHATLPCNSTEPYKPFDFPITPPNPTNDMKMMLFLGEIQKVTENYIIIRQCLSSYHPLSEYYHQYPDNMQTAYMRSKTYNYSRVKDNPTVGSYVAFWTMYSNKLTMYEKEHGGRIHVYGHYLETVFQSLDHVIDYHGLVRGENGNMPYRKRDRMLPSDRDCKLFLDEHGEDEKAYNRYWAQEWSKWWSMDLLQLGDMTDEVMESHFSMDGLKCSENLPWLSGHVTKSCFGKVPAMKGPYSLTYLDAVTRINRAKHIRD